MGEVRRVHETRRDRDVAIKVPPESMTRDRGRVARFEFDAKLQSLNHPRIAATDGFEKSHRTCFLALVHVEGDTMSQRLEAGSTAVYESLDVTEQSVHPVAVVSWFDEWSSAVPTGEFG